MNEERLHKKILDQAKKFKSRTIQSPEDMKRHDRIQSDEGKAMQVAHKQLGWSHDKIGNIFGRDPRAVQKNISKTLQVKDKHGGQDEKPSGDTNTQSIQRTTQKDDKEKSQIDIKEPMPTTAQEKSDICLAPPDNIDIIVLKGWGVPIGAAPEIIFSWRSWHRQGRHDICQLFPQLRGDLVTRKIPFDKAEAMLKSEIWAKEFQVEEAHEDVDLARVYRPWESINNQRALFQEIQERDKPMFESRKKHLKDVENLLKELGDKVSGSLSTKKYDGLLKMDENPFFESLWSHCFDVYDIFRNLKSVLTTVQELELDITS